ncbi:MAG: hypothetical protein ACREH3_05670 [Geminicoccales bacterium]
MKAEHCTFKNAIVHVDGHSYRGCRFEQCRLVYSGGDLPRMVGCAFDRCRWTLDGSAARTLRLMKAMLLRGGAMRELVLRSLGIAGATAAPLPDGKLPGKNSVARNRPDKNLH